MAETIIAPSGGGTVGGAGDVVGPAASVDGEVALYSGVTGKLLTRATGTGVARLAAGVQSASELSGDVTTSGSNAVVIANDAVSYAKMQNVSAAARLLGRGDSGAGDPQEIALGANLTMTGTTLAATGGGGGVTGTGVANQVTYWAGTAALAGSASFVWDPTDELLSLSVPLGAALSVQSLSTVAPVVRIDNASSGASTSTRPALALVRSRTAGEMADGFGPSLDFINRDSVDAVDNLVGRLLVERAGADNTGLLRLQTAIAGTLADRLTVDTEGTVAMPGGVAPFHSAPAPLAINTTVTESALYSFTVPAGTLGTSKKLRVTLRGSILANNGTPTFTFRVKYGATTLWGDVSVGLGAMATRASWAMDFILGNLNATNAQALQGTFFASNRAAAASVAGIGDIGAVATLANPFGGTAAEDSTTALQLAVTVQPSVNNINVEILRQIGFTELIG